jgi:hypothetical protein
LLDRIFILLTLFFIKHWYVDFVNQTQEEIDAKGTYGSLDGLAHSAKHGLGTMFVMMLVGIDPAVSVVWGALDMITHYHIDWFKMRFGSRDMSTKAFWSQFGLDQLAHALTYIGLVWLLFLA